MPKSGIAGSCGSSIFNFLRNLHTFLQGGCTNLQCHPQHVRIAVSSHHHRHLLFVDFLIVATLTGVSGYLTVVWIGISLTISEAEHLFMCLLAVCVLSLEVCLFSPSAHFLIELFAF